MPLTYPYSTSFFMDTLGVEAVEWDIVRFDEFDSQGTGHDLQSELADPKWTAKLIFRELYNLEARKVSAKVRKLDGSAFTFMVYDPSNKYPYADPGGLILGLNTVQVNGLGGDGQSLSLKGLPAGYVLTESDKGQIDFGTGDVYFFEMSENKTANGAGVTADIQVWPHVPIGIAIDQTVILKKPACKMTMVPGGFSPGRSQGVLTTGVQISALEHI